MSSWTSSFIAELLASIAERRAPSSWRAKRALPMLAPPVPTLASLCEALLSRRGEASGVAIAEEILRRWDLLSPDERRLFLFELARDFGPDRDRLHSAVAAWGRSETAETLQALGYAAEPRRQELIRRLNLATKGTARLVRMREEVLRHLATERNLNGFDADFQHLFASWFNPGFLALRRIDWSTSARVLERIIRYEAVHAIRDWNDLRLRIEPEDRRLFAFFHPQMVDDPLIFVEVALMDVVPSAIAPVLAESRQIVPANVAKIAVFYSISNCHAGLRGVSFGNFLIKQVAEDLKRELPQLQTFVTLSPVPGFAAWLARETEDDRREGTVAIREAVAAAKAIEGGGTELLTSPQREALTAWAVRYFLEAKSGRKPVDPVARFHLGNGARLERLHLLADTSAKGLSQAHGLMVNYLYDLKSIEQNHEAYAERGEIIASAEVRALLRHATQ